MHAVALVRKRLRAPALRRLSIVFGLWLSVAILYWPSTLALDGLWRNTSEETYTHGYLVLLIALWLIVRERKRLVGAPVRPNRGALVPLVLLSAAWVWSWRASIQEAQLMLVPLILFTSILAVLGSRTARVLAFPIGYLYFAMPFWSDGNALVRGLSAKMVALLIWLTGVPAYVQGDLIHLPGGLIEIAGSCSGLHTLIVGLALATLYGEVTRQPLRRRLTWLGVMGVLSLIVNWVRIFVVVVAAYFSHMQSSLIRHHYWLGWWLFAAAFAGFLWWTGRRSDSDNRARAREEEDFRGEALAGSRVSAAYAAMTLALLAALPALAYGMDWSRPASSAEVAIKWPAPPRGWSKPRPALTREWAPHFVNSSGESLVSSKDASGQSVEAFAVAYRVQSEHAKLLGYRNTLLGVAGALQRRSVRIVNTPSGRWREMLAVDSTGHRSVILSRYAVGERIFVRPRWSQLWYGLAALVEPPPLSSLSALYATCTPDCGSARARLIAAAAWLHPTLR